MNEALRHEIVQRWQTGTAVRAIARELGISRSSVRRVVARVQAERQGQHARQQTACPPAQHRRSVPADPQGIADQVSQPHRRAGPAGTASARLHRQATRCCVERMRLLRPRSAPAPVPRFETGPGQQAQMDHGVYDIDFTREGRRRVYLFSYLLGYSRRQYLRFVESMDLVTTLRHHVQAFHHLGGVARVCLYDNFKAVVLRHDADGLFYNPKFLAFATHYGFRPQACRVRRPQTKGKVERKFFYVETSLLNGRTFDTLEHLNEVTAWWLQSVADMRVLRDFKETPLERHQREQPHLLPLPSCDFDTAQVVYRHVNVEGYHHASAQPLLGPLVAHRPGAARAHHRAAKSSSTRSAWKKSPAIRSCPAPRQGCGKRSRAIILSPIPASVNSSCGSASANSVPSPCSSSTACSPSRRRASCKPSNSWP